MKNNLVAFSIFSFALCFVVGCWLISNGLNDRPTNESGAPVQTAQLFTQSEVANYLGISIEEVQKLTKITNGPDSFKSEIPHIEIEGKVYYPKSAIDRWLLNIELTIIN
ncbi:MAG: helix-turn-helix domain-containing protein [Mesobacillus sp.]|uniref:helix-turn-helix domain-containing protein n=1 Tax=Mesobacillus sp. TaxID=2675271 RepID=UPI003C5CBAEC